MAHSVRPRRPIGRRWAVLVVLVLLGGTVTALSAPGAAADPLFPAPAGPVVTPPRSGPTAGGLVPMVPVRVRDTRTDPGAGAVPAHGVLTVPVLGRDGIPAGGVEAVVANVTVTGATAASFVTVYPSGVPRPATSSVNFAAGRTVATLVVVEVGAAGNLLIYNDAGSADIIVDISGWYAVPAPSSMPQPATGQLRAVLPFRARDTRTGIGGPKGALGAGGTTTVPVLGRGGVPTSGVTAVVANVTVTAPTRAGFLTAFPTGVARPTTSTLNVTPGATVANLVIVELGRDGTLTVYNNAGSSEVVVDITGWYGPGTSAVGGLLSPVVPARVRDTRIGLGGSKGAIGPGGTTTVQITGSGGVPSTGVSAVVATVTVTAPSAAGFVTGYPTGATRPGTSSVNFAKSQTVANLVVVQLGTGGQLTIYNGVGSAQVIVDVTGYVVAGSAAHPPATAGTPHAMTVADAERATVVAKALQRTVQPDLRGLTPANPPATVSTAALIPQSSSAATFPVQSWGRLTAPADPAVGRIYGLDEHLAVIGTCTGTVVARNLVLTAGHCLGAVAYAFAPAQFGAAFPYGVWYASSYYQEERYQNGVNPAADFGFLLFNNPDDNGRLLGDRTGFFALKANAASGLSYSIGYPSEGTFNSDCGTATGPASCYPVQCVSTISQYQQERVDPTVSSGAWWSLGFGCPSTGGASGGPVLQQNNGAWSVIGVDSHFDGGPTFTGATCTRPGHVCWWYARNVWSPYFNEVTLADWATFRIA